MTARKNRKKSENTRRLKRFFFLLIFIPGVLFVVLLNWVCISLDHILFPNFRKVNINSPVFITGMPRSATTLCYYLLAANQQTFTCMKLWEIIFAPSVIQKKLAMGFYKIDKLINHLILKSFKRFDQYFFRPMKEKHPISLFNIEEDDYLFLHTFSTVSCALVLPQNKWFQSLKYFDETVPEKRKQTIMRYYKNCVKKHLYVFGPDKTYLAKSPSHTPKIKTLHQFFPGCHIIYMLRDPVETIVSTAHLLYTFKTIFHIKGEKPEMLLNALLLSDFWYYYPLVTCKDLHENTIVTQGFKQLTLFPKESIREIYNKLNISTNPDYDLFIENVKDKAAGFRLNKNYSVAEYGLDLKDLKEKYSFVYNHFHENL
jgi:omega-hydroxy-beta-dihydromenaquinone-9 sulfotransferase